MKFGMFRFSSVSLATSGPCASLLKKFPHLPIACAKISDGTARSSSFRGFFLCFLE